MPEDFLTLWNSLVYMQLDFNEEWQHCGDYSDYLSDRDLFAMYCGMSV